jgi:hypothetical protein
MSTKSAHGVAKVISVTCHSSNFLVSDSDISQSSLYTSQTMPRLPSVTCGLPTHIKQLCQLFEQALQASSRKPPFYELWNHALAFKAGLLK